MRRVIQLLFFSIHLALILLYNINSSWFSYHEVLTTSSKAGSYLPAFGYHIAGLEKWTPIQVYAFYSGIVCGYGFFGPQVSSCYALRIGLFNESRQQVVETDALSLTHSEGRIRYHSFLSLYRTLLPGTTTTDSLQQRIAKALAYSIGQRLAAKSGRKLAYFKIYVYRPPTLRTFQHIPQVKPITLYERYFITPRL